MQTHSLDARGIKPLSSGEEAKQLLAECGLPVADISPAHPARFFGIHHGSALVAVVGVELYGPAGLLRSLAVTPFYRSLGLARQLVGHAEHIAASEGVDFLYLLTTTASGYFEKLGFAPVSRPDAPSAIQATTQFAGLCPASSALLCKSLGKESVSLQS